MSTPEAILLELSDESRDLARALFVTHPEWVKFAHTEKIEDGVGLRIVLPKPFAGGLPLYLFVDEGEITIAFDRWHSHFDTWSASPEEKGLSDAREFLDLFLSERVGIAVSQRGNEWIGSRVVATEIDNLPVDSPWHTTLSDDSSGTSQAGHVSDGALHTYIRSWLGSFNREVINLPEQ